VVVLGAALGLARLDVQYDANGLRVRTGWGHGPDSATQAAATPASPNGSGQTASASAASGAGAKPASLVAGPGVSSGAVAPASTADNANAPWRTELMALERQLRMEMAAVRQGAGAGGGNRVAAANVMAGDPSTPAEAAFLRRVQQMIDQSEVRQQQNLALRTTELSRDFDLQRRTDLVRVEQGFGRLSEQREQDVAQQRQLLNAIRVSQQQP
jgi:hypothetical protein